MYLVEVGELAGEVGDQEAPVAAAHQHHLVPGQLREVVQGGECGLVTVLHILVTHSAQQTPDIVLAKPERASVVDIQNPVAELAEKHHDGLEVCCDDRVRASMRPDNQRDTRARPAVSNIPSHW